MNLAVIWRLSSRNSSLMGMLGGRVTETAPAADQMETIRAAILDALSGPGHMRHPHLVRRVRFAPDPETLWYLRADLMGALAGLHGESAARQRLDRISAQFEGLLPPALLRPSLRPPVRHRPRR